MNFKDMIRADVENIILNINEFAELINLSGIEIKAIVSPVEYKPYEANKAGNLHGISLSYITIIFKKEDYLDTLFTGKEILVNDKPYLIEDIAEYSEGLVKLTLNYAGIR